MEILRSIDFTKYRPLVLILEMIPYSKKLPVGQKNPEILAFCRKKAMWNMPLPESIPFLLTLHRSNKIVQII